MSSKSPPKKTSKTPSQAISTPLGKRKFIDSLEEKEYRQEIDLGSATRLLAIPCVPSSDKTIVSHYRDKHSKATKEAKRQLDLALATISAFTGSTELNSQIPDYFRRDVSPTKLKEIGMNGLCSNLYAHFEAGKFTDLTVHCQQRTWEVHRLILCSTSSFFDTCFSNEIYQENQQSTISLDDDSPEMINQLITFLYTYTYTLPHPLTPPNSAFTFHISMYILADKYGVFTLKCLARQKVKSVLDSMDSKNPSIAAFLEGIKLIYGTVLIEMDNEIRDLFAVTLRQHQGALKRSQEFMALIGSGLGDGVFDRDVVNALIP